MPVAARAAMPGAVPIRAIRAARAARVFEDHRAVGEISRAVTRR
jgi:hypothetical protein